MADIIEMKMPSPGESITEVEVAQLLVQNGDVVELDQPIAEIDSDKATLELNAEVAGKIEFLDEEGDTVEIGRVVCTIDTTVKPEKKPEAPKAEPAAKDEKPSKAEAPKAEPAADNSNAKATPVAKAMMNDNGVDSAKVKGSGAGGKILKHTTPQKATEELKNTIWTKIIEKDDLEENMKLYNVLSRNFNTDNTLNIRVFAEEKPSDDFVASTPQLDDVYFIALKQDEPVIA